MSMHIGLDNSYNNIHPHARCQIDDTITGAFYNSESNISLYAGKEYSLDRFVNLEIGLTTGYSGGDIVPFMRYTDRGWFVSPAYEYEEDNIVVGEKSEMSELIKIIKAQQRQLDESHQLIDKVIKSRYNFKYFSNKAKLN